MHLSKSRFTTGLQCHRLLWWTVHEPDARELVPDAAQQAIFDQGHRVGAVARERVPGGVLIDLPHRALQERVAATRTAIESGARVVYEASFMADDTFAAVDILERDGDSWRLIEVKSSTKVKPEHMPDVAVQLHVLRKAGLPVAGAELMHLNRACTYPDLDDLFTRVKVMAGVAPLLPQVPGQIESLLQMLRGPLPSLGVGPHCESPYECPFARRCRPELPPHHVSTLYYVGKRKWELEAQGYATVDQVPDELLPHPLAARQKQAVAENRTIVGPGLGAALNLLKRPVAVIDFETVAPAIPVWNGCHPFDQVPVQFSCHIEDGSGGWKRHEWLAEGSEDPRPELVRRLSEACHDARTLVAYYAEFERHCLANIGRSLPSLRPTVDELLRRLWDAWPIVRDHVYHPDFNGSFSLKTVLPALVPELSYDDLEIGEGTEASRVLEAMLLRGEPADERQQQHIREALLRYCDTDTWGVVRLLDRLRDLAEASRRARKGGGGRAGQSDR